MLLKNITNVKWVILFRFSDDVFLTPGNESLHERKRTAVFSFF